MLQVLTDNKWARAKKIDQQKLDEYVNILSNAVFNFIMKAFDFDDEAFNVARR